MGRVAWVMIEANGLASVDVQTHRTSKRGPARTSVEHVLAWAADQTKEIVVRDHGWDNVLYSAGPKNVEDLPPWPPAGYVAPDVPAAPTLFASAWSVVLRASASRADHEELAAAMLRALPEAHREPDDHDVVVTVSLPAMTELEANGAAEKVDHDLWKRVRKDPAVTFRWRPVSESARPIGPLEHHGPRIAYLEQFAHEDPSADLFFVQLTGGHREDGTRPHLQPYTEALAWARERSDVAVVRIGDQRFRSATDERPALPDPEPQERFDPPIAWTVALVLHVGSHQPTELVTALRAAIDGNVIEESFKTDEFANEPDHWKVTITATLTAATHDDAALALQSQLLGAAPPSPEGFMLSFDLIEPTA